MKIRKILSGALACTVTAGALPNLTVSAAEADWRTLYKDKLYEFMESEDYTENAAFELCDLSYDGIPELIISEGESHDDQCRIYTFSPYSGEFIDLGKLGTYGTIGYCSDGNSAVLSRDVSEDYEQGVFYHLKNRNNFTKILSYYCGKIGGVDKNVYKLNDNTVSERRYQLALQEYSIEEFKWLGRANDFSNEAIKAVLTEEWRDIYAETIHSIRESENYSDDFMFELYDINDDGIPELFVSDGNGYNGSSHCSVYTVYNGKIDFLYKEISPTLMYSAENKMLISSDYCGRHSFHEFFTLESGFLKRVITFESITGYRSNEYAINGEVVSEEEYSKKHEPYVSMNNNVLFLGRRYQMGDSAVEYVLNPPELKLTDKQKTLYAKELCRYLNSDTYTSGFDLCDLNQDEIPELIVSARDGCKIYTSDGDTLIDLNEQFIADSLLFDVGEKIICFKYSYCDGLYSRYCKMTDNCITELISGNMTETALFDNDEIKYAYKYEINGKETTEEQYDAALAEYQSLDNAIAVGSRYSLDLTEIASALYANGEKASPLTQIKLAGMAFGSVSGFAMEGQS